MTDSSDQIKNCRGRAILRDFIISSTGSDAPIEKFDLLTKLYCEVNSVINISALKKADDIYVKHYLDSIVPYKYFYGECCDVGCGGGFPCLPLAIFTGLNFTGVESVGKKLLLIKRCASELGIKNIRSEYARAEELAKLHRSYDTVCARAVADTDKVLSYCAPLAKNGGQVILYKTPRDTAASTTVCKKLKVELSETIDYGLPQTDISRRLFIYKKSV